MFRDIKISVEVPCMYRGKTVVVVTPAGRQRYLELLIPQILRYRPVVDEYRLWVNSENEEDIAYMKSVAEKYPGFVTLEFLPPGVSVNGNFTIHKFFQNCTQADTIYVRMDDDLILLDTLEAFTGLLEFRLQQPRFLVVYGNILNNAVIAHLHHRMGKLDYKAGISSYNCLDKLGWRSGVYAENIHRQVLRQPSLEPFRFMNAWVLFDYERVSINCICWLGETFREFEGYVHPDEEQYIGNVLPETLRTPNVIYGGYVCVHYAFQPQREYLEATDVIERYRERIAHDEKMNPS